MKAVIVRSFERSPTAAVAVDEMHFRERREVQGTTSGMSPAATIGSDGAPAIRPDRRVIVRL